MAHQGSGFKINGLCGIVWHCTVDREVGSCLALGVVVRPKIVQRGTVMHVVLATVVAGVVPGEDGWGRR